MLMNVANPLTFPVVFADSRAAIDYALENGADRNTVFLTNSPALASSGEAKPLGANLTASTIRQFCHDMGELSAETYRAVAAESDLAPLALTAARAVLEFEATVYKAMMLTADDIKAPFAVALLETTSHAWLNPPWAGLFESLPNLRKVLWVPGERFADNLKAEEDVANLWTRLRFEPWESIAFRLSLPIATHRKRKSPGTILLFGLNGLIKEAVWHLVRRGFGVRLLARPSNLRPKADSSLDGRLERLVRDRAGPVVANYVVRELRDAVTAQLARHVTGAAGVYRTVENYWDALFRKLRPLSPKAILANHYSRPEADAMTSVARRHGLPVCGVEHGTAAELTSALDDLRAEEEATTCDWFFSFSERGAQLARSNVFGSCRAVAVGAPKEMLQAARRRRIDQALPPIVYCTNQSYMGNVHRPVNFGITDFDAFKYESDLFRKVFSRLPHRVLYKPYPAFRYIDEDPAVKVARDVGNIDVFEKKTDLRYLLNRCRVLVLSFGHSTFSWCLLSGTPVVFIEQPDQNPLRDDLFPLFRDALFFVTCRDADWHDQLRKILSQDLDEIERQYAAKRAAREHLMETIVGARDGKGGIRIADFLSKLAT